MPFLHNVVSSLVFILVILILIFLYPTVGLCIQLARVFGGLIQENIAEMKPKPTVEKIGHAVAIGVYVLFFLLFGIVALPFYIVGWVVGQATT